MFSPERLASLTTIELREELAVVLPKDWSFRCELVSAARSWDLEISEGPEIRWQVSSPDERLALLHAYGWLVMRGQPKPEPVWDRTRELVREPVKTRSELADPEDLDPQEIQAVYGNFLNPRRK